MNLKLKDDMLLHSLLLSRMIHYVSHDLVALFFFSNVIYATTFINLVCFQVYNDLLTIGSERLHVYYRGDIKDRWFFKQHKRIAPIYLTTDPGWYIVHVSIATQLAFFINI